MKNERIKIWADTMLGIGSYFFLKKCEVVYGIRICYPKSQRKCNKNTYKAENKHEITGKIFTEIKAMAS